MEWKPIETAPKHGKQILVGFMGQFEWYSFVADAHGSNTQKHGFVDPTHWTEILPPVVANTGKRGKVLG